MTTTPFEHLKDHILVLGYSTLTEVILGHLQGTVEILILTQNSETASTLTEEGFAVMVGDPHDEDNLRQAQVDDARAVVVATDNDGDSTLSVLTTRQVNTKVHVVAGATAEEHIQSLYDAGADTVISPTAIVGLLLAESAIHEAPISEIELQPTFDTSDES